MNYSDTGRPEELQSAQAIEQIDRTPCEPEVQGRHQGESPGNSSKAATSSLQQLINIELSEEVQRRLVWADKIMKARKANNKALEKQLVEDAAYDLKLHSYTVKRIAKAVASRKIDKKLPDS